MSSLAPVLGAYAVNDFSDGKGVVSALYWIWPAVLLVIICWLLMHFAHTMIEKETLSVESIQSTDKEMLAFLVAYLLPIIAKNTLDTSHHFATALFTYAIVLLCISHSNAFHFNPLLGLVGYHFYEVKAAEGMTFMLITKRIVTKQKFALPVVKVGNYMYLEVGDKQ